MANYQRILRPQLLKKKSKELFGPFQFKSQHERFVAYVPDKILSLRGAKSFLEIFRRQPQPCKLKYSIKIFKNTIQACHLQVTPKLREWSKPRNTKLLLPVVFFCVSLLKLGSITKNLGLSLRSFGRRPFTQKNLIMDRQIPLKPHSFNNPKNQDYAKPRTTLYAFCSRMSHSP